MKRRLSYILIIVAPATFSLQCKKNDNSTPAPAAPLLHFGNGKFDNTDASTTVVNYNVRTTSAIRLAFDNKIERASVAANVSINESGGLNTPLSFSYERNDSTLVITPASPFTNLSRYSLKATTYLQSADKGRLSSEIDIQFITQIDSSNKFPVISDDALLDTIQKRTFKYFWDYAHPVSGLARERSNATPDVVTSGGSGFGVMAIIAAVNRGFITRTQGLTRLQTIVSFLRNTAPKFHGAFSHWMNGSTGAVVPFGSNDDGADIVETSYMMMGLLSARQFFNGAGVSETNLRNDINTLWEGMDWDWFRQNGKKVLYWNWSPNSGFAVNVPVQGWNECLITYVLAASSPTHAIPKPVYDSGYTRNGAMVNNATYYGYQLPLGPPYGGPLFFAHYSFLGIDPNGLSDAYANYQTQNLNHTKINYEYCRSNPQKYFGYSESCWGLTASDIQNGYTASSPSNDVSVIAPTAAISSLAYTPTESMRALKFFYYVLGDKIWGEYGFRDAFSLHNLWFANSYLAIDQGPILVMIENYRSKLLWNLFTSCSEVKTGMLSLGFSAPYL